MEMIWYNPDLDLYQKGTRTEFNAIVEGSDHANRFSILYQFNHSSVKLADKILNSLNLVRQSRLASGY
ncbi:MAG: hypothetical protein R8G66_04025 [Cytophagales bacterium]|nr:hypothetical protein [Cytophagales bacterium]